MLEVPRPGQTPEGWRELHRVLFDWMHCSVAHRDYTPGGRMMIMFTQGLTARGAGAPPHRPPPCHRHRQLMMMMMMNSLSL